ncbi:hypothetical protein G7078_06445 [Sphingomonas sinipercae]|uniref:Alpha 1,4-glycosyltransferase domain-containing protein n=1 Tax=Sphingomonas sinipercae TaxID=2714944 RepID=A0A6G7ZNI5_9SPHN|nr:hypothetical protein [Sphingomonas sinipercae]QIL02466.1 hypothetical protein G7078_06445 [Sphingomonas sinipercae]
MWVGERLGTIERACFRSILRQGHRLTLYCYEEPAGVPAGVELADANGVIGADRIFRHPNGSIAPFSDWFRLELQQRQLGTWLDSDIYLLRPVDTSRPVLFGEQAPGVLNNAVLRLPSGSPLLEALLAMFASGAIPDWLPLRAKAAAWLRSLSDEKSTLAKLPWGTTGPHALTAQARRFGLMREASPPDIFYPVQWKQAGWIRDPGRALEDVITDRTVAVHLWNECIKGFKDNPAADGSFLQRLQREGA